MTLSPQQAQFLYQQIGRIATAAQELGQFGETEPDLAGACGVEVCSLEARTILAGGYLQRLAAAAAESVRSGRPATVAAEDLEAASRLEGAVALGSSRIGNKMAQQVSYGKLVPQVRGCSDPAVVVVQIQELIGCMSILVGQANPQENAGHF